MNHIVSAVSVIDKILDLPLLAKPLKAVFGLEGLEHDEDFVSLLAEPLGSVQAMNWDPEVSSNAWDRFCETISAGGAGSQIGMIKIPAEVMNYASWIRTEVVSQCEPPLTIEEVCRFLILALHSAE